jgi:hypothetical protein
MTAKGQQEEELLLVRHNVGGALVPVPAGSRFESGVVQLQQRFRNEQTAKAKGMRKNKGTFRAITANGKRWTYITWNHRVTREDPEKQETGLP